MNESLTDSYDYVIVGGGAAGCVLASRLSADPAVRVALVEAGPSDRGFPANVKTMLPIGNVFLLPHRRYNWQYEYQGGEGTRGRAIACPRGHLLGGCTSVNGTVYIRGHRRDYDDWAAMGNHGWSWEHVLPAFKAQENHARGASEFHGSGGPLHVQRLAEPNPLALAFVEAAVAAGFAANHDFNGPEQDGFGLFDINQRNGARLSSSRAFLWPAMHRPNLTVLTGTLAERVELRGSRAVGVAVVHRGRRRMLAAAQEVVLCGGTVNSPQLLMLSGIGPSPALQAVGIAVRHELPGVGENLQDHASVPLAVADRGTSSYAVSWRSAPRVALAPLKYLVARRGMLASNAAEAGGFIRSRPDVDRPDIQLTFMVGMKENARTLPRRHGFVCHVNVQRPASRGTLALASADPAHKPLLRPRFLEDPRDVALLVHGLRQARRIVAQSPLAPFAGTEFGPGPQRQDDAALEDYIRANSNTTYHPVGTCKMGPASDPLAVVDPLLQVHGLSGLRVADASIMPTIVSGNTAAAAMMIGERAASFIQAGTR